MEELSKQLDGKGKVAILAGNQNAPNLRRRVDGIKAEAAKSKGIQIVGTFYHNETPQDAAAEVIRVNNAYPGIKGWAMAGGWALYTKTLLTDLDPAKVKLVAVDALPPELPYVEKGLAPVLLAQSSYLWGNVGVTKIIDKLFYKKDVPEIIPMDPVRVTSDTPRVVGAPAPPVGLPRRPRGIPQAEVAAWTTTRSSRFGGRQALSGRARAGGRQLRHRARLVPRALRRERRRQEHARQAAGGDLTSPTAGEILVDGQPVRFASPARRARGRAWGWSTRSWPSARTSRWPRTSAWARCRARGPFVDRAEVERRGARALDAIEASIDVHRLVGELTVAEQQLVQIAAAVGSGARVIIFDEPTSSLSQQEADHLYALLGRLRERGVTCVYVSHRMPEIFRLCDTITVLRDGRHVTTQPTRALDEAALVELDDRPPARPVPAQGDARARRARSSSASRSSRARASSTTSASRCGPARSSAWPAWWAPGAPRWPRRSSGSTTTSPGRVEIAGQAARRRLARRGHARGRGPGPRGSQAAGVHPRLTGFENLALPLLPQLWRAGGGCRPAPSARWRRTPSSGSTCRRRISPRRPSGSRAATSRRSSSPSGWRRAAASSSSTSRPAAWTSAPRRRSIRSSMTSRNRGPAILLISSELPELIALSDRMLVLREGRLVGELPRGADQGSLMRLMAGSQVTPTDGTRRCFRHA